MRIILLYGFTLYLMLISCNKHDGDIIQTSDTFPVYSSSVLEKVWESQLDSAENVQANVLIEDLLLISTFDVIYAFSIDKKEITWSFNFRELGLYLSNINANYFNGKLFIIANQSCGSDAIILDKSSGELIERLNLSDLPGVEGSCRYFYMEGDQIFMGTHRANTHPSNHFNFSFRLYQYDLSSRILDLLYVDSLIYNSNSTSVKPPVANYEQSHLYFGYTGTDGDNFELRVVEIPITGGEGKLVIAKDMDGKPIQTSNAFIIKDQILVTSFHWSGPYSILAFDLSNDGEIIWGRHVAATGNSILNPYEHQGGLYLQRRNNSSILQERDLYSGEVIWNRNFRNYSSDLKTIGGLPLGYMRSGSKNKALIDLGTGSILTVHNIVEVSDIPGDLFRNTSTTIEDGKKMVVVTLKGKIVCFRLPF